VANREHDRGKGRVQVGDNDRHLVDGVGFAQSIVVLGALLIGAGHHGL
jgi:hypothetical protein